MCVVSMLVRWTRRTADDMCCEIIGAASDTNVITSNLDKLMHGGVTFIHAYNMGVLVTGGVYGEKDNAEYGTVRP